MHARSPRRLLPKRRSAAAAAALAAALSSAAAAELTPAETHWLQGAWPVIEHANRIALPLDIVVQPSAPPGTPPLALGYVGGRCKLVLSVRGNAEAEATLQRIPPALHDAALELMAAHEIAHCKRYVDGAWHALPAGFTFREPTRLAPELHRAYADMAATRAEEAYADLVGLAWAERHHPRLYAPLHAWLVDERSIDTLPGSHHDTLPWLRLAARGVGAADDSIFAAAAAVWAEGLALP